MAWHAVQQSAGRQADGLIYMSMSMRMCIYVQRRVRVRSIDRERETAYIHTPYQQVSGRKTAASDSQNMADMAGSCLTGN